MANIASKKKRNRQNERLRQRNKATRSEIKTRTKAAETAIEEGAENAHEEVRAAQKRLGMAAQKGTLHRRTAARRQSRLMKKAAKAQA